MDADGSENKRLTERAEEKDKTAYGLVQIGPNSICCFLSFWEGCFLETQIKWAGCKLRSLQKNQLDFLYLQFVLSVSAFVAFYYSFVF